MWCRGSSYFPLACFSDLPIPSESLVQAKVRLTCIILLCWISESYFRDHSSFSMLNESEDEDNIYR